MINRKTKIFVVVPLSLIFVILICFAICINEKDQQSELLDNISFVAKHKGQDIGIKAWFSTEDNTLYLFLPSFVSLDSIEYTSNNFLSIDGNWVKQKQLLPVLLLNTRYEASISIGRISKNCSFEIKQSRNVGAIFITTETQSNKTINSNQSFRERLIANAFDSSGIAYYKELTGDIKGRGNASWYSSKKSYLIRYNQPIEQFEMSAAKNWILLGNGYDTTNIRNKVVYDFSQQLDFQWTPQVEYCTLYMNGHYMGLYLICERIELADNRIEMDSSRCLLAHVETASKDDVVTNENQAICVENWKYLGEDNKSAYQKKIQNLEDAILKRYNDTLSARNSLEKVIDVESWASRYLVDEIFGNSDAGFRSSFFFTTDLNEKFYGGPIWDYDASMGRGFRINKEKTQSFIAQNEYIMTKTRIPYYSYLLDNPYFSSVVKQKYKNQYKPLLQDLEYVIDSLSSMIYESNVIDSIRFYGASKDNAMFVKSYMKGRIAFLDDSWINETPMCKIQYEGNGGVFKCVTVPSGTVFNDIPNEFAKDANIWRAAGRGCIRAVDTITCNMELVKKSSSFRSQIMSDKAVLLSVFLLLSLISVLVKLLVDF